MKRILTIAITFAALAVPAVARADIATFPNVFANETYKCLNSCAMYHTSINEDSVQAWWNATTPGKATAVQLRTCGGSLIGTTLFGANPSGGAQKSVGPPEPVNLCIQFWVKTQAGEGGFTDGHSLGWAF